MPLGKYTVDFEMRVDYDRLRKERLKRAKDEIKKDGLGAIVTWDEANIRCSWQMIRLSERQA